MQVLLFANIHRVLNAASLTLQPCMDIQSLGSTVIQIQLTSSDLDTLKLNRNLATSRDDSYFTVAAGNGLVSISNPLDTLEVQVVGAAYQVNEFTRDSTRPDVVKNGFLSFDLDAGTFKIAFSEPVNATGLLDPSTLSFQHYANSTASTDIFQLESLSCPGCEDGDTVTFSLPRTDLNRLKLTPRVCTSAATCWLTIEPPGSLITDMAGNSLIDLPNGDRSTSRFLGTFVDDTTGPLLEGFVLNYTSRELLLSFDEPVDPLTIDVTALTVVAYIGATSMEETYQLTGGTILSGEGTEMRLVLSDYDINGLQSRSDLGTEVRNTWVAVSNLAAADLTSQQNAAQPVTVQATQVIADTAPPRLVTFDLDYDANTLSLAFSEPISVLSLDLTKITLISSPSSSPVVTYQITGGDVHPTALVASPAITLNLTENDITFLKENANIATSSTNTFLSSSFGLAEDTSGSPSLAIPLSSAVPVRDLNLDVSPPLLLSFSLDTNSGEIIMSFSDVVDVATFDVSAITLQGQNTRIPLEWHSLSPSSSSVSLTDSFTVTVSIGTDDLYRIKQIRSLALEIDNTYITVAASLVDDQAGNDLLAITDGKALQASGFIADSQKPSLVEWTLNMDENQLILLFSETMDIRTLVVGGITLLPFQGSAGGYSLTGYSQLLPDNANHILVIQLSESDSNAIKTDTGLGTGRGNSFISISSSTLSDMNMNDIVPIGISDVLQAAVHIADQSSPVVISYDLDLNVGLLSLTFDETVNADSFNVSELALTDHTSRYTSAYTFSTSTHSTTDSSEIDIFLSKMDLDSIKALTSLATDTSSTFLVASQEAVRDMRGNPFTEIPFSSALPVSNYTADTTHPQLLSFSLNLSSLQLALTFTETILAMSFISTEITLQSRADSSMQSIHLVGGALVDQPPGTVVTLVLSEEDANALKLNTFLATSEDNTFISLTSSAIRDTAGNPVIPIALTSAKEVAVFTEDFVPPLLSRFSLNLDTRRLSLTFNEPILASTFSLVGVALQDHSPAPSQVVRLTSFSTSPTIENGLEYVIDLSNDDFNAITATFPLATMETNTFLTMEARTVEDMNNIGIEEISPNNAHQITDHLEDSMRPTLQAFDFDLNLGQLTLVFSESVNITSFDVTQITFQSSDSSPSEQFTLNGGLVSLTTSTTIAVTLLISDLNTLKQTLNLASVPSNTFLSLTPRTVQDMNGNMVVSVNMNSAERVREFTEDIGGPTLASFDLDYDTGVVSLYFDETVDLSYLDPSALTLLADSQTGPSYTLISSAGLDSGLRTSTRIQLGNNDLNELKRLRVCTSKSLCFLSSSDSLVRDTAAVNNDNVEITLSSPLEVSNYDSDVTDPRLIAYHEFNLDAGTIMLELSETVDITSLNQSLAQLHDAYSSPNNIFPFFQLSLFSGDGSRIVLRLGFDDFNRLKLNTDLCTRNDNCWLRFMAGFLTDVSGNVIEPVVTGTMDNFHRPALFIPDTTSPVLFSFLFDLDSGEMVFAFDEVVQLSSFDPTALVFQDAPNSTSSISLRENGLFNRSFDGLEISWKMTKSDLNLLKAYELVFASFNSSYITYSSSFISDISLVGVAPRRDGVDALKADGFTLDTTRPYLEAFRSFNFDNGSITLQFSEPINISAIDVTQLAIANSSILDLHIYDPVIINDWYSVYYENGSIFNLTHLFLPGEYVLACPFQLEPTKAPPTTETIPLDTPINATFSGSGSGSTSQSASGSGFGSGNITEEMMKLLDEEISSDSFYPLLLRGCSIRENNTVIEPFHFLSGGDLTYVDERKQQIMVNFTREDLGFFKLAGYIAESDADTWVAYNSTVFVDMAENEVIPSNLFNTTKLSDGQFIYDVTLPTFEFFVLDLDGNVLSLYFDDVMDAQSVNPYAIVISDGRSANNSFRLNGPYDYPKAETTIDQHDDFVINIPLHPDDYNYLKADLDLATEQYNTYISFPRGIASDIYGRNPYTLNVPYPFSNSTQAFEVIPDKTGAILIAFDLNFNSHELSLSFNEVVDPNTYTPARIAIQNAENSSNLTLVPKYESHTLINGVPIDNSRMVSSLDVKLDVDASALKVLSYLANSENDTFITIELGAVLDSSGNPNQEILDGKAIPIKNLTDDSSPPYLEYFDLNMTANTLTLKFFEAVQPNLFSVSGITLWSDRYTNGSMLEYRQLSSNSTLTFLKFNSVVVVTFTEEDEDYLKRPEGVIATSINTSFITLESSVATDYVDRRLEEIVGVGEQVRMFFEGQY